MYGISTTTKTVDIPEFKIDDNEIEVADNFLFLGLNIDKNQIGKIILIVLLIKLLEQLVL